MSRLQSWLVVVIAFLVLVIIVGAVYLFVPAWISGASPSADQSISPQTGPAAVSPTDQTRRRKDGRKKRDTVSATTTIQQ